MAEKVTPRSEDYSRWYTDVVVRAELADYAPVRGTMVIRPYGYALWENMQRALDDMFKATGHQNAYFPLFIPYSLIEKEAEHVEGFSPQLAIVTHGGGKELDEPLVVRPTSETIVNEMFSRWIQSYRDLPILINQWCNVVRWEMRTRLFLRTMEFLWQEGHTAHETYEEAEEESRRMLGVYQTFAERWAAVPVVPGRKTESEKFPGADHSYSIEAMMGDRRALQSGTSHNLAQNFSRASATQFLDRRNELQYPYQTSWGASTRLVGMVVMAHGDDQGLKLPPKLAPYQVVVVPIARADSAERTDVLETATRLVESLRPEVRVHLDDREEQTPGFKFNEWEMKGVPIRVEVGPRDLERGEAVLARRDRPGQEGKRSVALGDLVDAVTKLLEEVQEELFARALAFREEHSHRPSGYQEMRDGLAEQGGFWYAGWCGSVECEDRVKVDTQATIRCIPFEQPAEVGPCIVCGGDGAEEALFAKAY
jgi:prolyl-tRNA synthetase